MTRTAIVTLNNNLKSTISVLAGLIDSLGLQIGLLFLVHQGTRIFNCCYGVINTNPMLFLQDPGPHLSCGARII